MKRLRLFFASMSGRIFLALTLGLVLFSTAGIVLSEAKRKRDIRRFDLEMTVERLHGFVGVLNGERKAVAGVYREIWVMPGTKLATAADSAAQFDPETTALLQERLGDAARDVRVEAAALSVCVPEHMQLQIDPSVQARCWLASLRLRDGRFVRIAVNTPLHLLIFANAKLADPLYLSFVALGFIAAAFVVAKMAAAPLSNLSAAADKLSVDLNSPPVVEHGPLEVRNAARAFNSMQEHLRRTLNERMQMLAAITHDLQTPLTRLRLRLEKVENKELRERLVADLSETQKLVEEGLDLARSSAAPAEPAVQLDLDSLLASLIEDEQDAGREVTLLRRCGCDVLARPQALKRCLANLIDNALKYGGSAEILPENNGTQVVVHVLDCGPGVPSDSLDRVFEPFVRLDTSRSRETGGTGLGLTIARSLAEQNGGQLHIKNRACGGLDVALNLPVVRVNVVSEFLPGVATDQDSNDETHTQLAVPTHFQR